MPLDLGPPVYRRGPGRPRPGRQDHHQRVQGRRAVEEGREGGKEEEELQTGQGRRMGAEQ